MSPIITHEDELELAKTEKELVGQLKKMAKAQASAVSTQKKFADNIIKLNIQRKNLDRTMRDLLKQLQTLIREKRSNVKEEEIRIFEDFIKKNSEYLEANDHYANAIKDVSLKKDYFITMKNELADAISEVADKRTNVIKKALGMEKIKNKMIEGEKLNLLEAEVNDAQKDFDRARDVFLKKIEQFLEIRDELDDMWMNLKDSTTGLS